MNPYLKKIERIKNELDILDNLSFVSMEESKNTVVKYDSLLDSLMELITSIVEDDHLSVIEKDELFLKAARLLSNYIGNAEDGLKYETIFNELYQRERINEEQFSFFHEHLNFGRWR